jgi:carboxyl-terminal processing protease
MIAIYRNSRYLTFCFFVLALAATGCKKDKTETVNNGGGTSTASRKELTLDSMFLYAKQIYYWNDQLPTYEVFNPRKYTSKSTDLLNYEDELYAISKYTTYEATTDGYPKYSFIDDQTLANPAATATLKGKSSVDTEGNGNDIGIRAISYLTSAIEAGPYQLRVTAVYPGSPADKAGVKRGWVITKVNGTTVGSNYTTENGTVYDALEGSSVRLEGYNSSDNVAFSLTLNKASYKSSPVYTSKVFTRSAKKIGYLAFARFSVLTNQDAPSDTNLDPVFADFAAQGVTDLVIDLRYNGGGYVNTAEYLADLIAPSTLSGKTMFKEYYNTTMQSGKADILKNQPLLTSDGKLDYKTGNSGAFYTYADIDYTVAGNTTLFAKKGSLSGVTNIVFIVSGSTASASELLINSMKPYMTVSLIGSTTYGKPVGFFPFTLENRYDVYIPLFETKNANDEGGYYTGMVPGTVIRDPSVYPFGDERELLLLAALNSIAPVATGNGAASSVATRSSSSSTNTATPVNRTTEFNGMIQGKHKLKN